MFKKKFGVNTRKMMQHYLIPQPYIPLFRGYYAIFVWDLLNSERSDRHIDFIMKWFFM